ncbi:MAG: putative quinol monooxygenase [Thermodesulfobacteriota bacterium]
MPGRPVTITVNLKAKPSSSERLKKVLAALIEPSRGEPGCLTYDMLQSAEDPHSFLLYMTWQDEAAFERHTQSSWVRDFDRTQAELLLDEPYVVQRWQMLG